MRPVPALDYELTVMARSGLLELLPHSPSTGHRLRRKPMELPSFAEQTSRFFGQARCWSFESQCRRAGDELFVAQCDHRINGGGTARGNVAGRESDKRQYHSDADIGEWITGTYAEEQCGHRVRSEKRAHTSE